MYQVRDNLFANGRDRFFDLIGLHQLGALMVDDFALVVGDVIVFEQVLANVKVMRLDLALRTLDLA